MATLQASTAIAFSQGESQVFGPFILDDKALSILVTAQRQTWPVNSSKVDNSALQAMLEISFDSGKTWQAAGGFSSAGGVQELIKGSNIDAPISWMRAGLPTAKNRQVRVFVKAAVALNTTISIENSITVGGSNIVEGFGSSFTTNFDSAGSNLLLYAHIDNGGRAISTVTYNGVDIRAGLIAGDESASGSIRAYKQIAPNTGTGLALTSSTVGDTTAIIIGVILAGVHQTTPLGTVALNTGSSSPASTNITDSASGELMLDSVGFTVSSAGGSLTNDASETVIQQYNPGGNPDILGGLSYKAGASGTQAMKWTASPINAWRQVVFSVKPAGGGFVTIRRRTLSPKVGSRSS